MEKGFVGWRQFLSERKRMLDAFDRAKEQQVGKTVQVEHGPVAEAEFRRWLGEFLPRRYGVTSGFIIPELREGEIPLRHFDVIVFDELESPVLWVEHDADKSTQGAKRALPAEHILAVFEIKSRLTKTSLRGAIAKLAELNDLISLGGSHQHGRSGSFFCAPVFFEFSAACSLKIQALAALRESVPPINMLEPIVLRNNDGDADHAGRFSFIVGDGVYRAPSALAYPKFDPLLHELQDVTKVYVFWAMHNFQMFAFEVLERLAGKSGIMFPRFTAMPPMTELR